MAAEGEARDEAVDPVGFVLAADLLKGLHDAVFVFEICEFVDLLSLLVLFVHLTLEVDEVRHWRGIFKGRVWSEEERTPFICFLDHFRVQLVLPDLGSLLVLHAALSRLGSWNPAAVLIGMRLNSRLLHLLLLFKSFVRPVGVICLQRVLFLVLAKLGLPKQEDLTFDVCVVAPF